MAEYRATTTVARPVEHAAPPPGLLLLMTIMSILGTGAPQIIIVLGLTYGVGSSRVIRGAVIAVKENAYFEAAQAVGSPSWHMVLRHMLPFGDAVRDLLDPRLRGGAGRMGAHGGKAPQKSARGRPPRD
ncbi:MAG: ABC transporter permease subunit [Spirochaetaceae bacterium]|nr:ABC transporter permease subunit [Spirochaetaceae bacterium]